MPNLYPTADQLGSNSSVNAFGKPYDLNTSANNQFGTIFRHAAIGMAPGIYQRIAFGAGLEPGRENAINGAIGQLSNPSALINQQKDMYNAQGAAQGQAQASRVQGMGGSQQAQAGAKLAAQNQGIGAGNQFQNAQYSPEGQLQRLQALMQMFGAGQNIGLDQLLPMAQFLEQRNAANAAAHQNQGLGALGGILGQGLGMLGGGNPLMSLMGGSIGQGFGNSLGASALGGMQNPYAGWGSIGTLGI